MAVVGQWRARRGPPAPAPDLRPLAARLDALYPDERLAGFTVRGIRLEARLGSGADPFRAVLAGALDQATPVTRWAIVPGRLDAARAALAEARRRDWLVVVSGDPAADGLLSDLVPVLGMLLAEMTPAQRGIARAVLLEGRSQVEVAAELRISRPSVSVAHARGHVREAWLLLHAVGATWRAGIVRAG